MSLRSLCSAHIRWLAPGQGNAHLTTPSIVYSLCQASVMSTPLKLLWVYCPWHAGVKGNNQADRRAGTGSLTSGLFLEDLECWGALDTTCRYKAKDITPSITWRREVWKEEELDGKRRTRQSFLKGWERAIANQTNTGTASLGTYWENFWETGWNA